MNYSLVISVNGPKSSDFKVYLTDAEKPKDKKNWFKVGRLQNISFKISADDLCPKLNTGFINIVINPCDEPDFSDCVYIFCPNFGVIKEDKYSDKPLVFDYNGVSVYNGSCVLGFIKGVEFSADVNGLSRVHIEAYDVAEWVKDIPDWIDLKLIHYEYEPNE